MDLHEIQDKLNALLDGTERKIVFWYDDDAAYEGDIDSLQLSEGVKVFKLTGSIILYGVVFGIIFGLIRSLVL